MTHHHDSEILSAFLDGDLDAGGVAMVEARVADCQDCAALLQDFTELREAAASLADQPPARDLWPSIARRIHGRPATTVRPWRRRVTMTIPQLAAAVLAAIAVSTGGLWLAVGGRTGPDGALGPGAAPGAAQGGPPAVLAAWDGGYRDAVQELEAELARRSELDPATRAVVERNLAIIDAALADAVDALAADPSNAFLNGYVADTMQRKVDLLRQATRIQQSEI
ncbi:MAG TPA: hypothetical protein VK966_08895 [Longimicrobiales bacterium]|nr:hypothetical protein [Longimicrobiales bacterium]